MPRISISQQHSLAVVGIVTRDTVLCVRAGMRCRAEIFGFVMTFDTGFKYGKQEQGGQLAAVWRMASHAFTTGHRTMTHIIAEETRMARAAGCHHQIRVHLHPVAGIVATAAPPLYHGTVP